MYYSEHERTVPQIHVDCLQMHFSDSLFKRLLFTNLWWASNCPTIQNIIIELLQQHKFKMKQEVNVLSESGIVP
jgi:hypothetical protein